MKLSRLGVFPPWVIYLFIIGIERERERYIQKQWQAAKEVVRSHAVTGWLVKRDWTGMHPSGWLPDSGVYCIGLVTSKYFTATHLTAIPGPTCFGA